MKRNIFNFGGAVLSALAFVQPAQAQTVSLPVTGLPYSAGDALRESENARKEAPPQPGAQVQIPQFVEPRLTIKDSERLLVRHFDVDGPDLLSWDEVHEVLAPYENRRLTLSEIYDAADQVTNLYRSRGYIVAKAYVPVQDARRGALRIKLIPGRYGAISLQNDSLVRGDFLQAVIDRALGVSPYIQKDELERALLLVSDLPGAGPPHIAIAPGKEPETSDFNVSTPEGRRVEGYLLGDNYGSPYTGRLRASGSLAINSPLGYGDRFSAFGIISERAHLANGRVAYAFPLGDYGLRGEVAAFRTTYALGGIYASSHAMGLANGVSATVTYPWRRQRDESIYFFADYTHKFENDDILGSSIGARAIDLGTLGVTRNALYAVFGWPLVTDATLSVTTGYANFPDALQKAENIAGVNTAGHYARINLDFNAILAFNPFVSLSTTLRAQKSLAGNLDAGEKLSVSGYFGVRSYDEGLAGDSGYVVTPELKFALPDIDLYRHSVGIFTDIGAAWLENGAYTTTQKTYSPLSDVGLGYYAVYQFAPTQALLLKAQLAHVYGYENVAPAYLIHTKALVQVGLTF